MDPIETIAEKLASTVILSEAADEAINKAGFVKLADNAWLAPLVGAGLGAVGGGVQGYLSSPDVEDDAKTRKRMLIGALTGGGLGGAGGALLHAAGTATPRSANMGGGGKGGIPEPSMGGRMMTAMTDAAHRLLPESVLFGLGGVGKPEERKGISGLSGIADWLGSKIARIPKVQNWAEKDLSREAYKHLVSKRDPIVKAVAESIAPGTSTGNVTRAVDQFKANTPKVIIDRDLLRERLLKQLGIDETALRDAARKVEGTHAFTAGNVPKYMSKATRGLLRAPLYGDIAGSLFGAATSNLPMLGLPSRNRSRPNQTVDTRPIF